jgi:hypothetical protein
MAPQVGLEPHLEIPTAETIVLKIVKNTRKTSVHAGFTGVFDLSLKAGKTCQVGGRQYKSSTFFVHEKSLTVLAANHRLSSTFVRRPAGGSIQSGWFRFGINKEIGFYQTRRRKPILRRFASCRVSWSARAFQKCRQPL